MIRAYLIIWMISGSPVGKSLTDYNSAEEVCTAFEKTLKVQPSAKLYEMGIPMYGVRSRFVDGRLIIEPTPVIPPQKLKPLACRKIQDPPPAPRMVLEPAK